MPRVPTYDDPQVRTQGYSAPRIVEPKAATTDEQFGGGHALDGMKATAGALNDALVPIQKKIDDDDATAIFNSKNALRAEAERIESEVKQRQGINAKGAKEWGVAELDKAREKINQGLTSDRQRKIFGQEADTMRINASSVFGDHETRHLEKAHDDSWAASKELAVNEALRNPSQANIMRIEAEITKANTYQAARRGWDKTTLDAANLEDTTKMHTGIIRKIMAGGEANLGAASAYLKANADKIDPTVAADVKDRIQVHAEQAAAVSYARKAIEGDKTLGEAVSDARAELGYGKQADRAVSEIRQAYAERELIKNDQINETVENINIEINDKGLHKLSDAAIEPLRKLDPARYRETVRLREQAQANTAENGEPYGKDTNLDTFDMLKEMIENGDIKDRRSMDLYVPDLTRGDHRTLSKMIDNLDKVDTKAVKSEYMSIIGRTKLTENDRRELNYIQAEYVGWIEKNKAPGDMRKFIADKMAQHRTDQRWGITNWVRDPIKPEYDDLTQNILDNEERRQEGKTVTDHPDIVADTQAATALIRSNVFSDNDRTELGVAGQGGDAGLLYKEAVAELSKSKMKTSEANIRWAMLEIVRERRANANKRVGTVPKGTPGTAGYGVLRASGDGY